MLAVMNKDQSKSFEVNTDHFSTALTMSTEEEKEGRGDDFMTLYSSEESFLAISSSDQLSTLQLSNTNENDPRLTTKGIITQINHCSSIRELSLSYSFLNDELLKALSGNDTLHLEILRVEAFPEAKSTAKISNETWYTFTNRFPSINLILLTYMTEEEDYEDLLSAHVPFTHLYFSECVPSSAVARVGNSCPRLVELVVSAYGPDTIDEVLIGAAHGCPKLSAVGLGDCEITCSGFVEFVSLCCKRLQILYVLDTSLLEDEKYDVTKVSTKVSSLLGKSWQPNYVPCW